MNDKVLGKTGEDIAVMFLRSRHHYKIIERNYRTRIGEIDIVAKDGTTIVFVEVKTRNSLHCGRPAEAVEQHKQFKLRKVAESYLAYHCNWNVPCRFDVIEILAIPDDTYKINHIMNAFYISS